MKNQLITSLVELLRTKTQPFTWVIMLVMTSCFEAILLQNNAQLLTPTTYLWQATSQAVIIPNGLKPKLSNTNIQPALDFWSGKKLQQD